MKNIYTENLILGSGISGLIASMVLAENNHESLILNKEDSLLESNTRYAQGGIAVKNESESEQDFADDISFAGNNINNQKAIKQTVSLGSDFVKKYLINLAKTPFEKDSNGNFLYTREGAHKNKRVLFHKDFTGFMIQTHLVEYIKKQPLIKTRILTTAIDIILNTHHSTDLQQKYKEKKALGVYALDNQTGEVFSIFCDTLIIATGGVGNIFTYTSNPKSATGDGIVMAKEIGCDIINAEYMQFHPTLLFSRKNKHFLISEALRGEGAKLINSKDELFMSKYHPLKDLAPRDEVSRAIYNEYEMTGDIFLDATNMDIDVKSRFQSIYNNCINLGIDIQKQYIPIVPGAHYFCGGIKVDNNSKTNIENVYAVGESACNGVHGSNRLASLSLLESLTYAVLAAQDIVKNKKETTNHLFNSIPDWVFPKSEESFDKALIKSDFTNMKNIMWEYVGIVRSKEKLRRAVSDLRYMGHRIEKFYENSKLTKNIIELRNSIKMSAIIAESAYRNQNSKGCHYRIN